MKHSTSDRVVDMLVSTMPYAKWTSITLNIAAVGVLVAELLDLGHIAQSFEGAPWPYLFLVVGSLLAGTLLSIGRLQLSWIAFPVGLLWLPMLLSEKGLIGWDYSSFDAGRAALALLLVGTLLALGRLPLRKQ